MMPQWALFFFSANSTLFRQLCEMIGGEEPIVGAIDAVQVADRGF
jgi:hypothetical protein